MAQQHQQQMSSAPKRVVVGDLSYDPSFLNRPVDTNSWDSFARETNRRADRQTRESMANMLRLAEDVQAFRRAMARAARR